MKRSEIKVNMKVIGNGGYVGTVVELHDWTSLVSVRYPGGIAMNDASELIIACKQKKGCK